ncbi:uncharacterized protein METZ01_LOCUS21512 [marine metagenome]|uniref:Uncharacterized protein n=1 Tax=marine metagenome TaxID=408172 RepID=A0A381PQC2_9ZZZZ
MMNDVETVEDQIISVGILTHLSVYARGQLQIVGI